MKAPGVYVLGGVADFRPPPVWARLRRAGPVALAAAHAAGGLRPLYAESLLQRGIEETVARCRALGVDLRAVRTLEVAVSYPRELAELEEGGVEEHARRAIAELGLHEAFAPDLQIRCRPTLAASSAGMVPVNDAVGELLARAGGGRAKARGPGVALVVVAGNAKGTTSSRPRLSVEATNRVFASLISSLDQRLTGASMPRLAGVTTGMVYRRWPALRRALRDAAWGQRLAVHERAREGALRPHVATHPDAIADRVVWEPMRLMDVAPQSMGYAGLILGEAPLPPSPERPHAVRLLGIGAGVDRVSTRDRADMFAAAAMMAAMDGALAQAQIADWRRHWIHEAHNAFPAVPVAELNRLLDLRGDRGGLAAALNHARVGPATAELLVDPAGGALAGHPIAPTTVRLLLRTAQAMSRGPARSGCTAAGLEDGAPTVGTCSAVGGHHAFDGFFVLGAGAAERVGRLPSALAPFEHEALNARIAADVAAEDARVEAPPVGPLRLEGVSWTAPDHHNKRRWFAVGADAAGRVVPLGAPGWLLQGLNARMDRPPTLEVDGLLRVRRVDGQPVDVPSGTDRPSDQAPLDLVG